MTSLLRSALNLFRPRTRRYEAAGGGRRFDRGISHGSFGAEALAASAAIRPRARHMAINNPYAVSGINAWTTALIGAGIVPSSQHPDLETRRVLGSRFRVWAETCDADGVTDFYGLQSSAARSLVIDGEAFIQIIESDSGPKLRLIPADQVASFSTGITGGPRVVGGIEFDSEGRRVAYHVFKAPPDGSMGIAEKVRVPASDMIHVFLPVGPGQVRGVSWLAPIMLRLGELDQLEDALLVGTKVAAMVAGFLTDLNGTGGLPFDGTQAGNILESGLEPGSLKVLPPGIDIRFSTPQQAASSIEFAQNSCGPLRRALECPNTCSRAIFARPTIRACGLRL